MKKFIWCPLALALIVQASYAQSLYDLVQGEDQAPIIFREAGETKPPTPPRAFPSIRFGGGMDFISKQGAASSIDFELGFLNKFVLGIPDVSFGVQLGLKINSQSTTWKVGGFTSFDLPVIIKKLFNPFVKLALSYQAPSLPRPRSFVLAPGFGGRILLGDKKRKYATIDIELVYQLADKKIFYNKDLAVRHALQLSTGLKVFL